MALSTLPAPPLRARRQSPWPATMVSDMRAKADADLYFFCTEVLGFTLFEGEPHGALCRWLQRPSRFGKRLVLMPRGSFKSSLMTVGYALWKIAKDPSIRVLIDSDLRANSKKFAGQVREFIEAGSRFRQLYGDLAREPGWTEDYFTVRREVIIKEPTVMTSGIDQVVVSLHFDLVIVDDLVNNTNINTAEQIEKAAEHIRLLSPLMELTEINPSAERIVLGTRWHDADVYGQILRSSGMRDDEIEERLEEGETEIGEWDIFYRKDRRKDGSPLFSLFTDGFLRGKRAELGSALYAANYENNPVPGEDAVFRREWFRYWKPPLPEGLVVVTAIDPAISERRHGDYSAVVTVGADFTAADKKLYVLEAWRGRVNPRDLINKVFETYMAFGPSIVGLEEVSFQRALRFLLEDEGGRRGTWIPVRQMKPDSRETKEMRLRALQPLFQEGQIYLTRDMYALEMELLRFPKGQHDDLVDALAYAFQLFAPVGGAKKRSTYQPENVTTGY